MGVKEFWKKLRLVIFILIISLGITILLSVIVGYRHYYSLRAYQTSGTDYFGGEEHQEMERIVEAVESVGDCEKIEDEVWRSYCYSHLARKLDDPDLCDKITVESDTKMLFFSKDLCLVETAKKSEDCEKVKTDFLKLKCYEETLPERLNSELSNLGSCDNVKEKFLKYKCIVGASEKSEDCEKIEPEFLKSLCYKNFAIKLDDFNLCDKIKEEMLKDKCVAGTPRNSEDCEKVQSVFFKSDCYHILAKRSNDSDLCNKIISHEEKRLCIAETAKTPEECEKSEWPSQCYEKLAERLSDVKLCGKIEDEEVYLKYECVLKLAKKGEDCEIIKSEYHRSECYANLAEKFHDSSLCEKVERAISKELCEAFFKPSLDDILNKETQYMGMLIDEDGSLAVCGDCFDIGLQYEWASVEWLKQGKCCYVLDLSHYEKPIGEKGQDIKLKVIVRKPQCGEADKYCVLGCDCKRIFFEVREVIEQ